MPSKQAKRKHEANDYGLYGSDGKSPAKDHDIPVKRCPKCHKGEAWVAYQYDDTPGFRETVYTFWCPKCGYSPGSTNWMEHIIGVWNGEREMHDSSPIQSRH